MKTYSRKEIVHNQLYRIRLGVDYDKKRDGDIEARRCVRHMIYEDIIILQDYGVSYDKIKYLKKIVLYMS